MTSAVNYLEDRAHKEINGMTTAAVTIAENVITLRDVLQEIRAIAHQELPRQGRTTTGTETKIWRGTDRGTDLGTASDPETAVGDLDHHTQDQNMVDHGVTVEDPDLHLLHEITRSSTTTNQAVYGLAG